MSTGQKIATALLTGVLVLFLALCYFGWLLPTEVDAQTASARGGSMGARSFTGGGFGGGK